jgi:hypothetical protein
MDFKKNQNHWRGLDELPRNLGNYAFDLGGDKRRPELRSITLIEPESPKATEAWLWNNQAKRDGFRSPIANAQHRKTHSETICHESRMKESTPRDGQPEVDYDSFKSSLLQDLVHNFGGYFFKRKSYYLNRHRRAKSSFFTGILQKFSASAKYDRRFFLIDLESMQLRYGADEYQAQNAPSCVE